MTPTNQFDYVIIGSGVAGLHLAHQFYKNEFFNDKQIAIVDKTFVPNTDRILSFWEKGSGNWDEVVDASWDSVIFQSSKIKLNKDLKNYVYKSLHFKRFSSFCLSKIRTKLNFHLVEGEVIKINKLEDDVIIQLKNSSIKSKLIFDSRISVNYFKYKNNYASVIQSFKGWLVEFDEPVFDTSSITMMDYRKTWKCSNSFMYILPVSNNKALFEYTFFAPFTISDKELDIQISNYIISFFPNKKYVKIATEAGEIPMSMYPFNNDSDNNVIKIGTAGGWVKASTGYSFKFAERNAVLIANQIMDDKPIIGYLQPKRFKLYDKLFIKVLQNQNEKGPYIFYEMYAKVKIDTLLRFLDEETSLKEEVNIIRKLPYLPFIKELF